MPAVFVRTCDNCHNTTWWQYQYVGGTRVRLNFIPVGTYGKKAALTCPVCDRGFFIDREANKQARQLADLYNRFYDRRTIDFNDYRDGCTSVPLWLDYADRNLSLMQWSGSDWVSADGRFEWVGRSWVPRRTKVLSEPCSVCGKPLLLRQGRNGMFQSCSDYPTCPGPRSTKDIEA
jgi:ssDNA-binding Zn-finger/Zn-ribbon topoisomerase 1